jgi:hypothetical protein
MDSTGIIGHAIPPGPAGSAEGVAKDGYLSLMDGILRRRADFFAEVFRGENLRERIRAFVILITGLSFVYGATMGASGFAMGLQRGGLQMAASGLKVPALYLLTLLICFPVLFIVLVLMGSRLKFSQTLALILLAVTLNAILLAAFAPIVLFFIVTGCSYDFAKMLHVAVMGFSGLWAMGALWQGLREMCETSDLYPKQAVRILQVWILIFGFVGTQMAWSLRPFVGSPTRGFQLVRPELDGNFYSAVAHSVGNIFRDARN